MSRLNSVSKIRSASSPGFTLLELMIAMVLLSVVILGVFESLTRQHKASIVTEDIVEVQNNTRAIASLIEREVRMAGFMVPNAAAVCGVDVTDGPDELYISETEPIVPDDSRAGDLGARITSGIVVTDDNQGTTGLTINLDPGTTDLDDDGSYFYDNDNNGTPEVDFRDQGGFIIGDLANPQRGAICGWVESSTVSDITVSILSTEMAARGSGDPPEELVIVPAARYRVNNNLQLLRNGDLLANSVEDFQIRYFFDGNNDGIEDAADVAGTTAANTYVPGARDNSTLKEVHFSIVVRSRAGDPEFTQGAFINYENRAVVAGNDNFRRRAIVGRVRPRNIGMTGSI
ncbi:MAG: PilW family protein [Myxococcota bacterium]